MYFVPFTYLTKRVHSQWTELYWKYWSPWTVERNGSDATTWLCRRSRLLRSSGNYRWSYVISNT